MNRRDFCHKALSSNIQNICMKKITIVALLLSASSYGFGQNINKLINQADVERIIKTLAADDMQGRGSFTPGIEKAAAFIEGQYKQIGLKPMEGNSGYRQNFTMTRITHAKSFVNINGRLIGADS